MSDTFDKTNKEIKDRERERREALALLAQLEKEEQNSKDGREAPPSAPVKETESWKDLIYPEEGKKRKPRRQRNEKKSKPMRFGNRGGKANRFLLAVIVLVLIIGAAIFAVRYSPSGKYMDARLYFQDMMSDGEEQVTLAEDERAVVLENVVSSGKARVVDGAVYLACDLVRENLNSRFFWDEENRMMLYTTALETYEIPVNSAAYTVDAQERSYERPVLIDDERGLYMSADFLSMYTNMEFTADDSHVTVHYQWGERTVATVRRRSAVRYSGGIKSLILTVVEKGENVRILDRMDHWSRVVTENGFIGYIPNRRLSDESQKEITREFEEPVYPSLRSEEMVNLVWHMIDSQADNSRFEEDTAGMHGVNVISPTWFSLTDNEGNFSSLASEEYVQKAHAAGLQVWGLVSNFSPDMSTSVLVSSTAARRNLVRNLIDAALGCGMDGINVDLEAIKEEAGYGYVQLIRELSIECRKNSLVLSVDVPVPLNFNLYYDRRELGTVADYVIVMGYDEHYHGSEAGSVASLSFEESGITETLKEVPKEKIISAVPFYTRMWYTRTEEDGSTSTWSEVLGMRAVLNTIESYGVSPQWDDDAQQYLAQWTLDDGIECRIWMEEETSLALKAALVKTYELGGIAEWVLGNQIDEMWDVIAENTA